MMMMMMMMMIILAQAQAHGVVMSSLCDFPPP
jgi:hypothetical protein